MPQCLLEQVNISKQQDDDNQYIDQREHSEQISLRKVLRVEAEFCGYIWLHCCPEVGNTREDHHKNPGKHYSGEHASSREALHV